MRLRIKDVIWEQKKSGSKARGKTFDAQESGAVNSGFWVSRRRNPPLGVTRRNSTTSRAKK